MARATDMGRDVPVRRPASGCVVMALLGALVIIGGLLTFAHPWAPLIMPLVVGAGVLLLGRPRLALPASVARAAGPWLILAGVICWRVVWDCTTTHPGEYRCLGWRLLVLFLASVALPLGAAIGIARRGRAGGSAPAAGHPR